MIFIFMIVEENDYVTNNVFKKISLLNCFKDGRLGAAFKFFLSLWFVSLIFFSGSHTKLLKH